MRFFVTGTPRSATAYAARLFRALAIPCSHERVARPRAPIDELVDWYAKDDGGESSWLAWLFLGCLPGPVPVLHTLRDPWDVVDSLVQRNTIMQEKAPADGNREVLRKVMNALCPEVPKYKTDIERSAALVIHWNRRITEAVKQSSFPYMRYQVEAVNADLVREMLDFIDVYRDGYEIDGAVARVPHNVNAGQYMHKNVEITSPIVRAAMEKTSPGVTPTIGTILTSKGVRMNRTDIESHLPSELSDGLAAHAEQCGYPLKDKEEIRYGTSNQSAVC